MKSAKVRKLTSTLRLLHIIFKSPLTPTFHLLQVIASQMDQIKQLQCQIDSILSLTQSESDEKWRKIVDTLNSCIVVEQERAIVAECAVTKTVQDERTYYSTRLNDMRDTHCKQI